MTTNTASIDTATQLSPATESEAAAAERARVDQVARSHGWRPATGDQVTLPDGTAAEVIGRVGQPYACRTCGERHPFPDIVTERAAVMGHATCELAPTVDTARAWLLRRAAHLDAEVAVDPGYPAAGRWTAEAGELRTAAAELGPVELAAVRAGEAAAGIL